MGEYSRWMRSTQARKMRLIQPHECDHAGDEAWLLFAISIITVTLFGLLLFTAVSCRPAQAAEISTGTASYYTVASAIREGTCTNAKTKTCLQANGQPLRDTELTAASWDYPYGTALRITAGRRSVICLVTDRGPARRLYRRGRILDLSQAAFQALAPLSAGVISVTVEAL